MKASSPLAVSRSIISPDEELSVSLSLEESSEYLQPLPETTICGLPV